MPVPRNAAFPAWRSQPVLILCTPGIGAYTKAHPFKCELLRLEQLSRPTAAGQFELAIAKEPEPQLGARWPTIASEKAFLLQLVQWSMGPWQIFLLDAAVEQTWTVMVNAMTLMDLAELQQLEAQRLERLHALKNLGGNTESQERRKGPRKVCTDGGTTMQRPHRDR